MKRLHVMGIGGSAMSALAILAYDHGMQVSGCDLVEDTPYIRKVKKLGIKTYVGHDASHLSTADIVAVTPATFFQNDSHPEVIEGKQRKIVITGREFEAKYLHKSKRLICVAGTHGKSTTTTMAALVFEQGHLDPSVIVGATVLEWESNCRSGKGDIFITESDEFYDNFLSYTPETIILNNIEFDHPDYFKDEKQLFLSFKKHIESLKGAKNLIINQDDPGIKKLLELLDHKILDKINIYGYTTQKTPLIELIKSTQATNSAFNTNGTTFTVTDSQSDEALQVQLQVSGKYNVSNALGVIVAAKLYGISPTTIIQTLKKFEGIGRRMELLGERGDILVYDDYAHHPTAIKVTLEGLKQKFPERIVWAVVEPHTFSRTKALLPLYENAFTSADHVIIAPIYKSRDKETFGINEESLVKVIKHKSIQYLDSFEKIVRHLKQNVKSGEVIIVMGAGLSYQLSRNILEAL